MKISLPIWFFKASGKYYSRHEVQCDTEETFHEIINRTRAMLDAGKRPGLVDGPRTEFHALLVGDAHPGGFPVMFPRTEETKIEEATQIEKCKWPMKPCICPGGAPELGNVNMNHVKEFKRIYDAVVAGHLRSDICNCDSCIEKRKL